MMIATPVFATVINNNSATCDGNNLGVTSGSVRLRAKYAPENINLHWYDENGNRITVPSVSTSCIYDTSINLPTQPNKPGYTFKGWKVLPYNPIEYIEATGTQWIDTGITRNVKGVTIETDVLITDWTNERAFVGIKEDCNGFELYSRTTTSSNVSFISLYNNSSGHSASAVGLNPNAIHTVRAGLSSTNIILNVDGVSYDANVVPINRNGSFVLFNLCYRYYAKVKMYYFKMYADGTLVRDMIPVKDISGTPCMYDKISGQFFYNQGTGNFIAGPDL